MPEAFSNTERRGSDGERNLGARAGLGLAVLAIAYGFYLGLFIKIQDRPEAFALFFEALLPAAMLHTAIFLLLTFGFRFRARGILIFWTFSAGALLLWGGWSHALAPALILLFGFVVARIGSACARQLLVPDSCGWGVSLAFGMIYIAVAGAFLAWLHLFKWWTLALILLIALLPDLRTHVRSLRADFRIGWRSFASSWNFPISVTLQTLFLTGIFAYVTAMAPETNSDAVRFYWPYIKLLRHYSGFFDGQFQWSYIIPQAGLIYGSAVVSLLGNAAVRLAMLLAWAALIGMVCRRLRDQAGGISSATVVVVASCPIMLWVASSLMLDMFVCVTVAALALLCAEGRKPDSVKFWIAVGICAGTAWAAKFSTLAYAVPLVAYAAYRCFKAAGTMRMLRGLAVSAGCFLITLSPWLVHSYQQSGNPIFPFLLKIFPSPLWPRAIGFMNLNHFNLAPGWRGWLLWPIDMTYHTSRFVEGYDGKLGLVLPVLLLLAIPVLWKGNAPGKALAIIGISAAGLLCSQTAYIRYWLPSLWLVALAAAHAPKRTLRSSRLHAGIALAAFLIMMPQILSSMAGFWADAQGWPWRVYAGRIAPQTYLGNQFEMLSSEVGRLEAFRRGRPKVWFTGYEAIGHLEVQPMEATVGELFFHTLGPRAQIQYLSAAGSEYWIVNEDSQDAQWFRAEGISHFFWNESTFVCRSGSLAVYRMPPLDQTLRDFDGRSVPGTDLLVNGGFETGKKEAPGFWLIDGSAPRFIQAPQALEGQQSVQLQPGSRLRQGVALPPGLQNVELEVSARSARDGQPVSFRYQVYTLGFEKDPDTIPPEDQVQPDRMLTNKSVPGNAGGTWQQFRTAMQIPILARYVVVAIDKPEGSGEVWIDSVHLYSR
jgi:hypothetical protein